MPESILKNIVSFSNLSVGVPIALPHLLNVDGFAVEPQLIIPATGGVAITASSTNLIATRQTGGPASINVYCEHWHTIEAATPPGGLGVLLPFIVSPGTGGSSTQNPVAFPAQWFAGPAVATQPPTALAMAPTNSANATVITMTRQGSIVGLSTNFIDLNTGNAASVTAGTLTILVTQNGNPVLALPHTSTAFPHGGQLTAAPGTTPYATGDTLGIEWQTDGAFTASSNNMFMFCWLEGFETEDTIA